MGRALLKGLLPDRRCATFAQSAERTETPARKQFQSSPTVDPTLKRLLDEARGKQVSEEELQEQRISFAYGNALESELITKESVRHASKHIRLG